jgi:hypothetical protein
MTRFAQRDHQYREVRAAQGSRAIPYPEELFILLFKGVTGLKHQARHNV